jgi:hypothetical protein
MVRLLILWAGWRLMLRLLGAGLILAAIALAAGALRSPTTVERRGVGVVRELRDAARPLISDAQHAVERALFPAGHPRR